MFIINPAAGSHRTLARWRTCEPHFRQAGIQADHYFTREPGDAARVALETSGHYDTLVSVGGDGTASEVAHGVVSNQKNTAALVIVPFGTGNDFANELGVKNEADSIRSLISERTRLVDVIQIHCQLDKKTIVRHALLFAGVGIICESLKRTTPAVKRLFGQKRAYPVGLLKALFSYRPPSMQIRFGNETRDGRFLFVGASNTAMAGGGMRIAPGASIEDGQFNINLIEAVGWIQALKLLRQVSRGLHTSHSYVHYFTAGSLEVKADPAVEVAVDGDLIGYTPAHFMVQPSVLRVRVP